MTNAVACAVTLCAASQAVGAPGAATCAASLGLSIPNTTITGAVYMTSPSGNFCQVNATVAPEHDVQINLPDNWKNRYLQTGGGGFDGQVPRAGGSFAAAGNDLVANGYVVTADNGGHRGALHPGPIVRGRPKPQSQLRDGDEGARDDVGQVRGSGPGRAHDPVVHAARNSRLYMGPGVQHCGGGNGADSVDLLTTLTRWVEQNEAPGSHSNPTLAWKQASSTSPPGIEGASFSRPLCPFPDYPHYVGKGDVNSANSYVCRPGSRGRPDER